jgi:AcrR family transcriptional regulator
LARQRVHAPRQPEGPRAQRSIDALRASLLELIEVKSIDEITIRNITDAAGLSYPTFFRRFARKEELLEDIAAREVREVLSLGSAALQGGGSGSGKPLCDYVHAHRRLWRTLLTGGASGVMRMEFMRIAREIADSRPPSNPWLPTDLAVGFVTGGIIEVLTWWMNQPDDYPVSNVIKLFDALIVDNASRPRDIRLD